MTIQSIYEYQPLRIVFSDVNSLDLTIASKLEIEIISDNNLVDETYSASISTGTVNEMHCDIPGGVLIADNYTAIAKVFFDENFETPVEQKFQVIKTKILSLLNVVKSEAIIGTGNNDHDQAILYLINSVILNAIDFMDNPDIMDVDTIPESLMPKLLKQVGYEYRRRKDFGLSSVTFPDGNVNKFMIDEWLPDVLKAIQRHGVITI